MTYTTEWQSAQSDIRDAGSAVTFTRTINAEAAATGLLTPTNTSISGYAVEVGNDPDVYKDPTLIETAPATLLFAATTYGDIPRLGDDVVWASVHWTVRDVNPVSPDTIAIITRVVVTAGSDQPIAPGAHSSDFSSAFA